MPRTVVLEHLLPDGSAHLDWLIEPEDPGERASDDDRVVLVFHVEQFPDTPGLAAFEAEAIGDHRRLYLWYEGEVSGGRGRVRRVAEGTCHVLSRGIDGLVVRLDLGRSPVTLRGRPVGGARWRFERVAGSA